MNQLLVGKFITRKRKEKNLTQEQLAEKIGVSNKTISKWETGKCMPDYSVMELLCEELNITLAELMNPHYTLIVAGKPQRRTLLRQIRRIRIHNISQ